MTSSAAITVTASSGFQSTYLALPSSFFGTRYIVAGGGASAVRSIDIVAVNQKADVVVQLPYSPSSLVVRSSGGVHFIAGDRLTLSLLPGERQTFTTDFDLTGTIVQSSKLESVAVFARLESGLVVQLLPTCAWGRRHVAVPVTMQPDDDARYQLQVTAPDWITQTSVTFKVQQGAAQITQTVAGGESYVSPPFSGISYVESDSPIQVIQVTSLSSSIVVPIELFDNTYAVAVTSFAQVAIITSSSRTGEEILMNGKAVSPTPAYNVPGISMTMTYVNISFVGYVELKMSGGSAFGAYVIVDGATSDLNFTRLFPAGLKLYYNEVSLLLSSFYRLSTFIVSSQLLTKLSFHSL